MPNALCDRSERCCLCAKRHRRNFQPVFTTDVIWRSGPSCTVQAILCQRNGFLHQRWKRMAAGVQTEPSVFSSSSIILATRLLFHSGGKMDVVGGKTAHERAERPYEPLFTETDSDISGRGLFDHIAKRCCRRFKVTVRKAHPPPSPRHISSILYCVCLFRILE